MTRPAAKQAYVPGAVHACGVGSAIYNFVLAYDKAALKQGPADWKDFFDLKGFPGKRALRQGRRAIWRSP